jgi:PPOX class probable F420-dependent enzyme
MTAPSPMSREEIETFLAEPRNVMVAAIRPSGMPQMTPNWFYWDGTRFYISTTKTRRKFANLSRDPRVQLAIDDPTAFRTVILDGAAEIWDDIEAGLPFFKKIMGKHRGQVPDDDTLRRRLQAEQRVLLVITPARPPEEWTRWGR